MSGSGTNRSMMYLTVIICLVFGSVVGYLLAMNDYEPRIYEKDGLISDYLRQITDLNTSIISLNETLVYQDGNITAYKQEITELEALLIDAENQIEDQTDIITTLSNRITTLEAYLNITSPIFPEDWSYKKQITITGSPSGNLTDYQIKLNIHKGVGSDSTNNIYCNGHCQPDFDDIRFTEFDGETLLNYWIEEITETQATVWVKINSIPEYPNNCTIYLYYGNINAYSISNGELTFIFFDDFESGNFDKWHTVGSNWMIQPTQVMNGEYAAYCQGGGSEIRVLEYNLSDVNSNHIMVSGWYRCGTNTGWDDYAIQFSQNRSIYSLVFHFNNLQYYFGWYRTWPSNSDYSTHTWYNLRLGLDAANPEGKMYAWKDEQYLGSVDSKNDQGDWFSSVDRYRCAAGTGETNEIWFDDFYIRKWIQNEPTISEISGEINPPT